MVKGLIIMKTKICTKCGVEKDIDMFNKATKNKDGHQYVCRECARKCVKEYQETHKEERKEYNKINKVLIAKQKKKYNKINEVLIAEQQKKYEESHKEVRAEQHKLWGEINKESKNLKSSLYSKNNRDKCNVKHQKRRAKEKKLSATYTALQWVDTKLHFMDTCCYCGRKLSLQQEHFQALVKNGDYTINNIIPSCGSCNKSKGAKDFFEWYPKYRYYSKKREKAILEYLGCNENYQQLKLM